MTTKIDDSPPTDADDKPMLLSEEQVKQEQQVKPAVTTNLMIVRLQMTNQ